MKILYYDCFAGISGDMNLAALIDLGVPEEYLRSQLSLLQLRGYTVAITREKRSGITGTRIDVILDNQQKDTRDHDEHHHDHIHKDKKEDSPHKEHAYLHRNLSAVTKIITDSSLGPEVKNLSISIFTKIAEAEAAVHAKAIDEIHFHEVGAVDSLVDIVGAAISLDYLKPDKVLCSTLELGSGFVTCQHGILPVPAPATVEITKSIPTKRGGVPFEATTPTGAAILATVVDEFTDTPAFATSSCGYGIGHTLSQTPNMLRILLGRAIETAQPFTTDSPVLIECNIDDMNPEWYEYIFERLLASGADDVYLVPIIMKKSRPGITLSVLCSKHRQKILDCILRETSTLGVRIVPVEKIMLERKLSKVKTKYGEVSVKSGLVDGSVIKSKPEYADCKRLAVQHGVPIRQIYAEVEKEALKTIRTRTAKQSGLREKKEKSRGVS